MEIELARLKRWVAEQGGGGGDNWGDPVDADITPDADGTRDLGATATRFAETYTDALDVTNNIAVGGTVDGRDVATDGTKLDGIEASANNYSHPATHSWGILTGTPTTLSGYGITDAGAPIPVGTTDGAVLRWETTSGAWEENTDVVVDSSGSIAVSGTVDGRDIATDGTKLDTLVSALPGVFMETGSTTITSTAATVGLDSETLDPDANYSITTNEITVTTGGYFNFQYSIPVNDDGTAGGTRARVFAWVERDQGTGTWITVAQSRGQDYAREASGGEGVNGGSIMQIADGEKIRLRVQQSGTTALSTESGESQMALHRIRA